MAHIERSITIDAPRDAILEYSVTIARWPEWAPSIIESSGSAERGEQGVTHKWTYKMAGIRVQGEGSYTEVSWEEGRAVSTNTSGIPGTFTWTYDAVEPGRTQVKVVVDYTLPGRLLGKVAGKLIFERYNEREIEHMLQNLKTICEAHAKQPAAAG